MIRRDYVVKQLEEFGKVIARLLSLRKQEDHTLLEKEIADAAQRFTNFEISAVERLGATDFYETAIGLEDHRLKMLADLLYEKMHFYLLTGQSAEAILLKNRCRQLYELVKARNPGIFDMDVYYKVQFLDTV